MSLATIIFPNGALLTFEEDGRWSRTDAALEREANAFVLPPIHRPNPVRETAEEIAEALGGKVIFAVDDDSEIPDDATP